LQEKGDDARPRDPLTQLSRSKFALVKLYLKSFLLFTDVTHFTAWFDKLTMQKTQRTQSFNRLFSVFASQRSLGFNKYLIFSVPSVALWLIFGVCVTSVIQSFGRFHNRLKSPRRKSGFAQNEMEKKKAHDPQAAHPKKRR